MRSYRQQKALCRRLSASDKGEVVLRKALYIVLFALCLSACSVSNDNGVKTTTTAASASKAETSVTTAAEDSVDTAFGVGDTWEVEGQWKLTVTDVWETEERDKASQKQPAAVYIVSCEYENLGYEDSSANAGGLVFKLDEGVVDSEKYMGYPYTATIVDYPQQTPVGAKCKAQYCIGVDNAGDFQLNITKTDGSGKVQTAVFEISTQGIKKVKAETEETETTETTAASPEDTDWTRDKFMSFPVCYTDKNVYSEPDKDSKQLGFVTKGEKVNCIGRTGDKKWLVIEWQDEIGFIGASDVHE